MDACCLRGLSFGRGSTDTGHSQQGSHFRPLWEQPENAARVKEDHSFAEAAWITLQFLCHAIERLSGVNRIREKYPLFSPHRR